MQEADDKKNPMVERAAESLKNLLPDFQSAYKEIVGMTVHLNNVFGQLNQRVNEVAKGLGDAIPKVVALGGSAREAFEIIRDVSEETKRNVIASSDVAAQIFSINQILQTNTKSLISDYESIGIQMSRIAPEIEKSIFYIQNVGMNAKEIMRDVQNNIQKMNEHKFQGGVEGLTKMAAQASMLKFSMEATFQVADRALDPEKAIQMSSAFQRMGVSVGDLTDPFQLMYKSLMDPKGLNESLGQMTKQFAVFNEETKSFEISPAGIMQMRELSDQTEITYKELSQSALAVANLDRAMGQLDPNIMSEMSEEEKMLLMNVAQMDKMGDYTVKLQGDEKSYKLEELTQEQFKQFIEEQKVKSQMKVEDIAYQQLETLKGIDYKLRGAADKVAYGVTTTDLVTDVTDTMRKLGMSTADILNKAVPDTSVIRGRAQDTVMDIKDIINDLKKGDTKDAKEKYSELKEKIEKLKTGGDDGLQKLGEDLEKNFNEVMKKAEQKPSFRGRSATGQGMVGSSQKIDLGGTVTFKVEAPPGVSKNDLEQYINSTEFKQKIYQYIKDIDIEKEKTSNKTP
jgi:ElaB/YqjD/DUF883 family membrane-anchored ribosome-binding protein